MDDKIKKLFLNLVDILIELKQSLSSPTLDKKTYKSKISSKVVQLRMQKSEVPVHVNIDDFIKQCERVSLTLGLADIDRALLQWQSLNDALNLISDEQTKSKSGLELICEKYHIIFKKSPDDAAQKEIDAKEIARIKEKYKI